MFVKLCDLSVRSEYFKGALVPNSFHQIRIWRFHNVAIPSWYDLSYCCSSYVLSQLEEYLLVILKSGVEV